MRHVLAIFLALVLLLTCGSTLVLAQISPSLADQYDLRTPPDRFAKAVPDLIVVRPFATLGALLSTSAFLVTLPVVYPTNTYLQVVTPMVEKPWGYVSNRPWGVFAPEKSIMREMDERLDSEYSEFLGRTNANGNLLNLR